MTVLLTILIFLIRLCSPLNPVFLTVIILGRTYISGLEVICFTILILVCFYFSLRITVFYSLTVFISYLTCVSFLVCFFKTSLLTVFLIGLSTCCYLLTVFISHLVLVLNLFLSSLCTWQYLCLCIWSAKLFCPQSHVFAAQQAFEAAFCQ